VSEKPKKTKTDRSLSPMRIGKDGKLINDDEDSHGRKKRRLAQITNKDWALSEIYYYVLAKTQVDENG
jgi:hypothetical protein